MKNKIKQNTISWEHGKVSGFKGKNLLNLANGTLKLIKIEPLATYPEHIHPDKTEFAYVLEGNPSFKIDTINYESEKGDFFIFPVTKKHAILNKTNNHCLLFVGAITT